MARLLSRAAAVAGGRRAFSGALTFPTVASTAAPPASRLLTDSDERLLRLLRSEPEQRFKSFAVEDRPGEVWTRLVATRSAAGEVVRVDANMFDGNSPMPGPDATLFDRVEALERGARLHLSFVVQVSRAGSAMQFFCSAWPDSIAVQRVLMLPHGCAADGLTSIGRKLKNLKMREYVMGYLAEREVDNELAVFLHEYMKNKENLELLKWLKTVESFVRRSQNCSD